MNREQKVAAIERMKLSFGQMPNIMLARFRGLTVNQSTELRSKIRAAGGTYAVIRNRLARRAAAGTPAEELIHRLDGPCAVVAHESDPVELAKALSDFAKKNPQIEMVAGLIDAQELVDEKGLVQLASLPSLPELRQQLASLIASPATSLVRLLNTPGGQLARVVDARREKLEGA